MLINNTINTTNHFGGAKPPKDPIKEIYKLLETKSNKGHVHKKSDIEDFAHTHDERYYRKDISELQLLLSGNGTPNYEQGEHDDLYIDELNGDLYKKVHDSWIRKTDLKGDKGDPGVQGPPGEKGNPFTYEDFTEEQLEALRGPQGEPGKDGKDADTYDDTELRQLIDNNLKEAKAYTDNEIATFDFVKIVDELPEIGLPNKVYFVPKTESDTDNIFDEYAWINNDWEYFGTKIVEVDLTDVNNNIEQLQKNKADKTEIPSKTSELDNDSGFITEEDLPEADGILTGSVVGWNGDTIPEGYEEVDDPNAIIDISTTGISLKDGWSVADGHQLFKQGKRIFGYLNIIKSSNNVC